MKPFNLSAATAGAPVVTRDGRVVKQLTYLSEASTDAYQVIGVVDNTLRTWTVTGTYHNDEDEPSSLDLLMAKTKRTGWMNVYVESNIHTSKEEADRVALSNRVDCVLVTWEM